MQFSIRMFLVLIFVCFETTIFCFGQDPNEKPCDNLVTNGSFESVKDDKLVQWNTAGDSGVEQELSVDAGRNGGSCAKLQCKSFTRVSAASHAMMLQSMNAQLKKSKLYSFQCWVRSEAIQSGAITIDIVDEKTFRPAGLYIEAPVTNHWSKIQKLFQVAQESNESSLLKLVFFETGILWVDDVELVEVNQPVLQFTNTIPDSNSRNLLPNSSFECGSDGWSSVGQDTGWGGHLSSLYGQLQQNEAWHGASCLKIQVGPDQFPITYKDYPCATIVKHTSPLAANTGLIKINKNQDYTLSVYMRSDNPEVKGKLAFRYADPGTFGFLEHSKTFSLTSDWQRYSFTERAVKDYVCVAFGPDPNVSLKSAGTVWLDGGQLECGQLTSDYEPLSPIEIGVSTEKFGNVYESGESVKLKVNAFNAGKKHEKLKIEIGIQDYFGRQLPSKYVEMDVSPQNSGQKQIDLGINNKGFFAVRLSGCNGGKNYSKELRIAVIEPYKFKDSPFGINHAPATSELNKCLLKAGITWAREWSLNWQDIESEPGKFSFDKTDAEINRILLDGLKVHCLLPPSPSSNWASSAPADVEKQCPAYARDYIKMAYAPKNSDLLGNFISTVAQHYKGSLKSWEFLNEPFYTLYSLPNTKQLDTACNNLSGANYTASDYVSLLKVAHDQLKKIDPNCILVGGIGGSPDLLTRKLIDANGLNYMDVLNLHIYPGVRVPEYYIPQMEGLQDQISRTGRHIPIWMTEYSYYGTDNLPWSPFVVSQDAWGENRLLRDEKQCAEYSIRFTAIMMAHGVEKIFYHSGLGLGGTVNDSSIEALMLPHGGIPRKLYAAQSAMANILGPNPKYICGLPKGDKADPADSGVYGYSFQCEKQAVVILWQHTVKAADIQWQLEQDKGREVFDIIGNRVDKKSVLLDNSPIYIVSTAMSAKELAQSVRLTKYRPISQQRAQIQLDGSWKFTLDPNCQGADENWFLKSDVLKDNIEVPGCWNTGEYGSESKKLKHDYVGKAWYRKEVSIPASWQDKRVFICFGGVHRYARVWVNDKYLGEHVGYLSPFEYDITNMVKAGQQFFLSVEVDSKQRTDVDEMQGCIDLIDYMWTAWGGISGHVTIEARPQTWIDSVFIRPMVEPVKGCKIGIGLSGSKTIDRLKLQMEVLDAKGKVVKKCLVPCDEYLNDNYKIDYSLVVDNAILWTPDSPYLYMAKISLLDGDSVVDVRENRFGIRDIQISGRDFLVNGKKFFLRGYGDDSVYPETFMPPLDKEFYKKRLKLAKAYGFNFVRDHSAILPQEYYEACDEIGMFVSAEFPIGYQRFYKRASSAALQTFEQEWTAAIKKLRNHPSIFNWCMGNEIWDGVPLSPQLYKIAKELDPDRLVVDSDGLWSTGFIDGKRDRDTLDFYYVMFNVWSSVFDNPEKFKTDTPKKPIISHENGNFVTFPDLNQISLFKDNFKPFWLVPVKERLAQWKLYSELPLWVDKSERLYHLLHKADVEAIRKNPNISGYHWWLFQDYWTTSNGLVNLYWKPKSILPEDIKSFNGPVVLLQDGLRNTYQSHDKLKLSLKISNYSESALSEFKFRWSLKKGSSIITQNQAKIVRVDQGSVETLTEIEVNLPDFKTPTKIELFAEALTDKERFYNNWTAWVYPSELPRINKSVPVYISSEFTSDPVLAKLKPELIPESGDLPPEALYIVKQPSLKVLQALENGASVLLISPQKIFETDTALFKTSWWNGAIKGDRNTGTVVYDYDFLRQIAPEGWCDNGWFNVINGAQTYILDEIVDKTEVMVRAIDVPFVMEELLEKEFEPDFGRDVKAEYFMRNKAFLFQTQVGKGKLVVSGFNFKLSDQKRTPEGEWLLNRIVDFMLGSAKPKVKLDSSYLRSKM